MRVFERPKDRGGRIPLLVVSGCIPITRFMYAELDGKTTPLFEVDLSSRPDVADLPRVIRSEDVGLHGRTECQAAIVRPGSTWVVLVWIIRRPVNTTFRLAFTLEDHRELLEVAAAAGHVGLLTEPMRTDLDDWIKSDVLWLPVDGRLLPVIDRYAASAHLAPNEDQVFSIDLNGLE